MKKSLQKMNFLSARIRMIELSNEKSMYTIVYELSLVDWR